MRLVIDTNIIVSAFLTPNGNAAILMDKVFGEAYEVIVTKNILVEYEEVLQRKKFGFSEEIISFVLTWFREHAVLVDVNENDYSKEDVPDPKDAVFYVAARATGSRLVTGNIKHYPVEEMRTMLWELM